MRARINEYGHITRPFTRRNLEPTPWLPRYCPFNPDGNPCGDWCVLLETTDGKAILHCVNLVMEIEEDQRTLTKTLKTGCRHEKNSLCDSRTQS